MRNYFIKIVFVIIASFSFISVFSQETKLRYIDSLKYANKLDSLNLIYGQNKVMPEDLKLCFLIAMSHYPELSKTKITFKKTKIKTTLSAKPTLLSVLFKSKSNRTYVIRINNSIKPNKVLICHADFNSKIGLLGHELGHIYDYSQINLIGVIKRALFYSFKKSKKKFENRIDVLTIERGLGWQLYDWSYFVLNKSCATEKYKLFKKMIYLTPEQIIEQMLINGYIIQ